MHHMRVLVDYQIFLSQKYGGISNYHSVIHQTINEMQNDSVSTILALGSDNRYIHAQGGILKPLNIRNRGKNILRSINQYALKGSLSKYDVFHPTYYDNYFLNEKTPPVVVTIHDVIAEKFFTDDNGKRMIREKKNVIGKASAIIAISETTKKQLLNFYPLDPDNIAVIPHGSPVDFLRLRNEVPSEQAPHPERPYILYVGLRWTYKNFLPFVEGIADVLIRHNIGLKVAGPPPNEEESKTIARLKLEKNVSWEIQPTQQELFTLYKQALFFAFPSLDEGFGLPLLEAAAADCPVLCSDTDIFREICGDSALYFDPYNRESIALQTEKMLTDEAGRQQLVRKAFDNLKNFSWRAAAERTLDVYRRAAQTA